MQTVHLILLSLLSTAAHCNIGEEWTKIIGSMTQVYANADFVWGVNPYGQAYICARPCTGNWIHSADNVRSFDTESIYAWVVNTDSYTYLKLVGTTGSWGRRDEVTNMIDVASGSNTYVWFLNNNKDIYRWRHVTSVMQKFPGKFDQIDAGFDYVYAVNATTHAIYVRRVDGRGDWRTIPGKMKYVTAGMRDIFAIGMDSNLYRCEIPCAGLWEAINFPETGLSQIDATIDGLFAVTSGGVIYYHEIPL